jgi:hypothetical protein
MHLANGLIQRWTLVSAVLFFEFCYCRMGNVAHMRRQKCNKILVGKLYGQDHLGDVWVNRK